MANNQVVNSPIAQAQGDGTIYIPALGMSFQQVDVREDDIYGSFYIHGGLHPVNSKVRTFDVVTGFESQHLSLSKPKNLGPGEEAAIYRCGIHPRGAHGNVMPGTNDIKKVLENGILDFRLGKRQVVLGPLIRHQSGYGLTGFSTETGVNAVSVGVASGASAPILFVPQQITHEDDINPQILFQDAQWITTAAAAAAAIAGNTAADVPYAMMTLTGPVVLTMFLRGVLKSPLGK